MCSSTVVPSLINPYLTADAPFLVFTSTALYFSPPTYELEIKSASDNSRSGGLGTFPIMGLLSKKWKTALELPKRGHVLKY